MTPRRPPSTLPHIRPEAFPEELRALPRFVAWCYEWRSGRKASAGSWTKVPVNPHTGGRASSTDPATWGTLGDALARAKADTLDGIGFVLGDGLLGIDLDDCVDGDGKLAPEAARIRATFAASYAELSPSRRGLHIIGRGRVKAPGNTKPGRGFKKLEIYDGGRYFTLTGWPVGDTRAVADVQDALDGLHADYFGEPQGRAEEAREAHDGYNEGAAGLDDEALLARMFAARNGDNVRRLWDGDDSAHDGDASRSDEALLCHLAYWTKGDAARMERLFSLSVRGKREKWNRPDYRARSIAFALRAHRARAGKEPPGEGASDGSEGSRPVLLLPPFDEGDDPVAALASRRGGLPFPVPGLGHVLEPLHDELVLIAGPSSVGKTTLCVQLADFWNENGVDVLYLAAEQSRRKLEAASLSRRTGANSARILRGDWPDDIRGDILAALAQEQAGWLPRLMAHRRYAAAFPRSAAGVVEIVEACRRELGESARLVVVLDALHNLRPAGGARESRRVEIDEIVDELRNRVCQNLGVPLLAVSHLSREGKLKESSGLDYLGDVILMLDYDEEKQDGYRRTNRASGLTLEGDSYALRYIHARVAKQRDGDFGRTALLAFHPPAHRFVEACAEGGGRWES